MREGQRSCMIRPGGGAWAFAPALDDAPRQEIADDPRRATATQERPISLSLCASASAISIGRRDAAHVRPAPPTRQQPDDATTP
jgi:hypothetical protein